jgi:hypothetical protein
VEDSTRGEVGPGPAFWSRREMLPFVVPFEPACVVLLGLYHCKVDN